jgi:hypothetical protein
MPRTMRHIALRRLVAVCLVLVLFAPAGLSFAHSADLCSCGMRNGCVCKLMVPRGAHCGMFKSGAKQCAMKSLPRNDTTSPQVAFEVRVLCQGRCLHELHPDRQPAGSITVADWHLPAASSPAPEVPPPRSFRFV